MTRYIAWRVEDLAAFRQKGSKDGRPAIEGSKFHKEPCERCGAEVWASERFAAGLPLVCWPCVRAEK